MEGGGIVTDRSRDGQRRRRRRIGSATAVVFFILLAIGIVSESHSVVSAERTYRSLGRRQRLDRLAYRDFEPVVLGTGGSSSRPRATVAGSARARDVDGRWWPGPGVDHLRPDLQLDHRPLWALMLDAMYTHVLGGYTVHLASIIGVIPTAICAFVVSDFLFWFTHWSRHKVPTFWYFHAVHHAAPDLNTLTDNRVHFVEAMVSATLVIVPARLLGLSAPAAFALAVATTYFTAFTHTAVRTNMGPLRYILVTPQSHRVHHSHEPEHIDVNFGTVFSIWDQLFRTQYRGWEEYPDTGIADPKFPLETKASPPTLVVSYARMVLYPFRQIVHDIGKYRRTPTVAPEIATG